ncbi:MAG: hypothetical protein AAF773_02670 [Cyanobacteria bacterium P01_D01_bin.115]
MTRLKNHASIAGELQPWSDEALLRLLNAAQIPEVWHGIVSLPSCGTSVFVKLVPLTSLEMQSQHYQATNNCFQLPPYYQYRLGSCGFGAWRELATHRLVNQWVLSDHCSHFPLLHHWRVLPIAPTHYDDRIDLQRWGNCEAIHQRVAAIAAATHSVVLFLEPYPLTLSQWFREQWSHGADRMATIMDVESTLIDILSFINSQGLLHLDAHFDNILTDGQQLFLTDYGLALSNQFQLDVAEQQFLEQHQNFDICTALTSLVHAIVSRYDDRQNWRLALQDLTDDHHSAASAVPTDVRAYLKSRLPLVMEIGDSYRQLLADLTAPYPAAELQNILNNL